MIAILREQSYTVTHSNKNEQLSEVNKMKNQNFGVEIELTGITRKELLRLLRTISVRLRTTKEADTTPTRRQTARDVYGR